MSRLPIGEHAVCVVAAEPTKTKDGRGSFLALTLECISGEYMGRRHVDRLNLENTNDNAKRIAFDRLNLYCHCLGITELKRLEDLRGKPFLVELAPQKGDADYLQVRTVKPVPEDWKADAREVVWQREAKKAVRPDPLADASSRVPEPLSRELPAAPPFPLDALGPTLGAAARAIVDRIQCADAIAAQSVLGAASLAVQAHANVIIPATGHARPLSLFLLTVAESGERKTAADEEALKSVRAREKELFALADSKRATYDNQKAAWDIARKNAEKVKGGIEDIERALAALPSEPIPPQSPMLTCDEPTFEGLCKLYEIGAPSLGLFSGEGAHFVSGHGMKAENRLAMAAGLSSLWDGSPIKRVRAGSQPTMLPGRRLSMHLMMQPDVSSRLLSDPELKDQGLLSRMLVCAPQTMGGTRFQRAEQPETAIALARYVDYINRILATPPRLADGTRNELAPRNLPLSYEAADLWRRYADYVEGQIGPTGAYEPIKGLANKLPEHAARLAAVIALVEYGPTLNAIPPDAFMWGTRLAEYYASEALRLWDSAVTDPEIKLAKKLLAWLHERDSDTIALREIYRQGLSGIRTRDEAIKIARVLEAHNHVVPMGEGIWIIRR